MGVVVLGGGEAWGRVGHRVHDLLSAALPASVAREKWALSLVCDLCIMNLVIFFIFFFFLLVTSSVNFFFF